MRAPSSKITPSCGSRADIAVLVAEVSRLDDAMVGATISARVAVGCGATASETSGGLDAVRPSECVAVVMGVGGSVGNGSG